MIVRTDDAEGGSERTFGIIFSVLFLAVGIWPLLYGDVVRLWALFIAVVFSLAAFLFPALLKPLNKIWFHFGLLLHHIVNPCVMAILFFGVLVPAGLLLKLIRSDPLKLQIDKTAPTYWIDREPPGPDRASMRDQF